VLKIQQHPDLLLNFQQTDCAKNSRNAWLHLPGIFIFLKRINALQNISPCACAWHIACGKGT